MIATCRQNEASLSVSVTCTYLLFFKSKHVYLFVGMHAAEHAWQSEDNWVGQFSHVGIGDETQVIKLGRECLYTLSYLTGTQEEILNGRAESEKF